jgi:glycosyltransferase involved in cell wall biosynthesis
LLVPPESPPALAEAIHTLLADRGLRLRMGRAARAMVESEYDWGNVHDQWVALYRRVRERACEMV